MTLHLQVRARPGQCLRPNVGHDRASVEVDFDQRVTAVLRECLYPPIRHAATPLYIQFGQVLGGGVCGCMCVYMYVCVCVCVCVCV